MLLEGDSGSGKTGSLASLVAAGYKLRILDYDNGLESLKQYARKECPDKINNVEYRTLNDKLRATPSGPVIEGVPRAYPDGLKMLDHWKYGDVDLGVPAEWGPECIFVLDSLTFFSEAVFDWCEPLVAKGRPADKYDNRTVYYNAQSAVEKFLQFLKSDWFQTNVIVISHIKYVDNPDGTKKGYPTAIGSAISPTIPSYFNSVALCQTGPGGKRTIKTASTAMIDLKNPKPFAMLPSYPLETGLAEFFKVLREQDGEAIEAKRTEPKPTEPKTLIPVKRTLGVRK